MLLSCSALPKADRVWFTAAFDAFPHDHEIERAQADAGYPVRTYGEPRISERRKLDGGGWFVKWYCPILPDAFSLCQDEFTAEYEERWKDRR